jgi:hypothetical protein
MARHIIYLMAVAALVFAERIYFTGTSASGDPITFDMHYDDASDYMPFSDTMPYNGSMMGSGTMGRGMMGNFGAMPSVAEEV